MNRLLNTSLTFALCLSLSLSLAACGSGGDAADDPAPPAAAGDTAVITPEDPPAAAAAEPSDGPADEADPAEAPAETGTPDAPAEENTPQESPAPTELPDESQEVCGYPLAPPDTAAEPAPQPTSEPAAPAVADSISLADIRDKMLSDLGISDYMEVTASRLLDLYGIQEADLAQSASFATMSGAFPGEVILIEAVDADAASRIAGLLQNRLNEVLNQYKTYDAETYALAEACTVDTDGKVVSMLLSPERSKMRKILTDSLG